MVNVNINITKNGRTVIRVQNELVTLVGFPTEGQNGLYLSHFSNAEIQPRVFYTVFEPACLEVDRKLRAGDVDSTLYVRSEDEKNQLGFLACKSKNNPENTTVYWRVTGGEFAGLHGVLAVITANWGSRKGERMVVVKEAYGAISLNAEFVRRIKAAPINEDGKADVKQARWMPIIKTQADAEALLSEMALVRTVNEKLREQNIEYQDDTDTAECPW